MKENLLQQLIFQLNNANIKQLLHFILVSSVTAITILAVSTIVIENYSYDSQKILMENIIRTETLTKNINHTISSLILRNRTIAFSNNIDSLMKVPDRTILEKNFKKDLNEIRQILSSEKSIHIIEDFETLFKKFALIDDELFSNKQKLILLVKELNTNQKILDDIVNEIINAIDSVSGKIKLKATRTRIRINKNLAVVGPDSQSEHILLLDNLLAQQRQVESASHQVQLSAS